VDDPFAGDERQHKSWRDLPPTPPLVWSTAPPLATAAAVAGPASMPVGGDSRRPSRRLLFGSALLIGAILLVGTGLLATGGNLSALLAPLAAGGSGGPGGPDTPAAVVPPQGDEPLADMAERLLPSVVQIEAGGAMGSGFVAADGGLILTASHVVGTSDVVTLTLHDGTTISGTVVAVDKSIDTAVIRADTGSDVDLPPLALGPLAEVQVGEMTIAIGSPFGLSQTVTTGIVSALGRTVPTPMGELHDLIQTDAAINSGNSGGPLIDGQGRAIGINTAIASASGGSDGVGFAVPVDQAAQILEQVQDGTWRPEDNDPAESLDPLGGMFDQFFGPDGLDGLEDLFGLGPDGMPAPDDPSGGSGMADQLLRQLLEELLQSLVPEEAAPQPPPDQDPAPAPEEPGDSSTDAMEQLMQDLMDELFQGLSPNGFPEPYAPDGADDGLGI
jgi:putative serine protease PepD